ncbi:hypothetical protein [Rhodopirellula baltica]|uniref:hypothetical protein n=1 Tax=Rhodopirellula baltica TaxID=265606 RepID=UPI001181C74B|nr:hypothetical protein [Rhodopirellula baltica]
MESQEQNRRNTKNRIELRKVIVGRRIPVVVRAALKVSDPVTLIRVVTEPFIENVAVRVVPIVFEQRSMEFSKWKLCAEHRFSLQNDGDQRAEMARVILTL